MVFGTSRTPQRRQFLLEVPEVCLSLVRSEKTMQLAKRAVLESPLTPVELESCQCWGTSTALELTFLGASPVRVRPRVWGVLCVSSGSALFCPVEIVRVILSEKANVPVLKATVELSCQRRK